MDILHKVAEIIIKLFYNICTFFLDPIFLFSLIYSNVASLTLCTLCRAVFLPAGMTGKTLAFMHEVGIWDPAAPRWAVEPKRKTERRPQSDRDTKKQDSWQTRLSRTQNTEKNHQKHNKDVFLIFGLAIATLFIHLQLRLFSILSSASKSDWFKL